MNELFKYEEFIERENVFHASSYEEGQIRSKPIESGYRISIVNDEVLQMMFNNNKRRKYPLMFLSILFDIDYEDLVEKAIFFKNRIDKADLKEKSQVGDVMILYENTLFSIEVNGHDTLKRNQEYVHRAIGIENEVGRKDYRYYDFIQINLLNFRMRGHEKIVEVYKTQTDERGLYGLQSFVNIFLLNLRDKYYNEGVEALDQKERLVMCLVETSKKRAKELAEGNEFLMDYNEELARIAKKNYRFRTKYEKKLEELESSRLYGLELGIKKGLSEGRVEGHMEGLEDGMKIGLESGEQRTKSLIANNMYSKGVPISKIADYMNVPVGEVKNMFINEPSFVNYKNSKN